MVCHNLGSSKSAETMMIKNMTFHSIVVIHRLTPRISRMTYEGLAQESALPNG